MILFIACSVSTCMAEAFCRNDKSSDTLSLVNGGYGPTEPSSLP